jgi:hypothetical protein
MPPEGVLFDEHLPARIVFQTSLTVVHSRDLSRGVMGCRGLSWSVVVCRGLSRGGSVCLGLSWSGQQQMQLECPFDI